MGVLLKLMEERRISTANYITFVNPALILTGLCLNMIFFI